MALLTKMSQSAKPPRTSKIAKSSLVPTGRSHAYAEILFMFYRIIEVHDVITC